MLLEDGDFDGEEGLRGGDTLIQINPNFDAGLENGMSGDVRSDVALFHELAHSYNDTYGLTPDGDVDSSDVRASGGDPNVARDAAAKRVGTS